MIRQAQTYLVSAMSGATLIAIAIVAFVLLVSVQVFRDWPIAALGGSDEPHISDSRAASAPPTTTTAQQAQAAGRKEATKGSNGSRSDSGPNASPPQVSEGSLAPSAGPTATTSPVDDGSSGSGNQPSSSPAQSPSGSGGSGQSSPSSGGGSKSGSGSSPVTSTTGQLTETVNNTVNQVDETVAGGALEKAGVTQVTEGVVNGIAGPESPVGKVVDGTVETVTGLLGGGK